MADNKLIFIGLDGVGLELAADLVRKGVMPHLGRLIAADAAWTTASPLPEISPVCWTTMFSGADPGEHGVFGFGEHLPGSYQMRLVDARAVKVPRLWDHLSALGRRVVVANVPLTYPASPVAGVMVSGFVTPELTRAVHPLGWLKRLKAVGYRPEGDLEVGRADPAAFIAGQASTLATRLALFTELLDEPWCLYAVVFTDTDRVNHFLWPALADDAHPLCWPTREVYTRIDDFIGQVLVRFATALESGEATLLVAADHSFGPIRSEVYLNPWLIEAGYLKVEGPPGAERILPESTALALDPGRIYLHRAGRFPAGQPFSEAQAHELVEGIRSGLMSLRFKRITRDGCGICVVEDAPVAAVHAGRELYHGPNTHLGPDLVATPAPGFSLRAGLGRGAIYGLSHLTGTHQPSGALALAWPPLAEDQRPSTVRGLYGLLVQRLGLTSLV
jgi:predicted AlkP superfamily phosphohydrolase/phosphomutase